MKKTEKGHDTGLRILEVLKILLNDDIDKKTMIEKLQEQDAVNSASTYEAYLKYFNTLELLGLNIDKENDTYFLKNALINTELTHEEKQVLMKIIKLLPDISILKNGELLINILLRLDKYINFDLRNHLNFINKQDGLSNTVQKNIINTLKQLQSEKLNVIITFKQNRKKEESLEAVVKKIAEKNGHFYVICHNSSMKRGKKIWIDSILSVTPGENSSNDIDFMDTSIVFEVYGRLAKSYKLKQGEILDSFGDGYTRIINKTEDYDTLLNRLLKYGENCKILHPSYVTDDFLKLTNDILNNLENV